MPIACAHAGILQFVLILATLAALAGCDDTTENAVLWRIQREGYETSYLFGTMHVATPDIADPAPAVREALLAAELFAGETDLEFLRVAARAEMMMAPDEERVHRTLDAALLGRVVSQALCYGLGADDLRDLPMWAVVWLFTLGPTVDDPNLQGAPILDEELAEIAKMAGIPVVGLETETQYLAVFRDMSRGDQVGLLREVGKRTACVTEDADPWLDAYRQSDLAALDRLMEDWLKKVDEPQLWRRFYQRLGDDRNPRLADRMEHFMKATSSFFAVGAAHLTGEDGLVALLRRRGWTVEPVE